MSEFLTDRERERARFVRLSDIADRLNGDSWCMESDGDAIRLISDRSTGERATLLTIHSDALADELELIGGALDHLFLFLALRSRAADTVRSLRAEIEAMRQAEQAKNFSAQAAMLLSDNVFQRFLETKGVGGPVRDKQAADTRLKSLLAISSKKQINTDPRARAAFLQLRDDFKRWRGAGR